MYQLVENLEEYREHAAICRKPLEKVAEKLRKEFQVKATIQPVGSYKLILMLKDEKGTYYVDYHIILTKKPMQLYKEPRKLRTFIDSNIQNYCKARKDTIRKNSATNLRYALTTAKGERFVLHVEFLYRNHSKTGYIRLVYNKEQRTYGWNNMPGSCADIATRIHRVEKYHLQEELRQKYLNMKNAALEAGEDPLSLPTLKQACVETLHLLHKKDFTNTSPTF